MFTADFHTIDLFILFNKSFQPKDPPYDWKITYITPTHKKGSRNVAGNYRPISLTSTIVKLMESIIKSSAFNLLISNNLVLSSQFDFYQVIPVVAEHQPTYSDTMALTAAVVLCTSPGYLYTR